MGWACCANGAEGDGEAGEGADEGGEVEGDASEAEGDETAPARNSKTIQRATSSAI